MGWSKIDFLVFKINFEKSPNVFYFPQKLTQESNFVTNLVKRKSFSLLATKTKFTGLNRALGVARGGEKICETKYLEYKKKALHTVYSSAYVVVVQTKTFSA